jgi:hypothetical protein
MAEREANCSGLCWVRGCVLVARNLIPALSPLTRQLEYYQILLAPARPCSTTSTDKTDRHSDTARRQERHQVPPAAHQRRLQPAARVSAPLCLDFFFFWLLLLLVKILSRTME